MMMTTRFVTLCAVVLAALSSASASASAVSKGLELEKYSFEQFVQDFGLHYHPSEIEARRKVFNDELRRVIMHNARNAGWKEGINKFSAMTASEKKAFTGRNKRAARDAQLKNEQQLPRGFQMKSINELPRSVDWREKDVVSAVKDQGHCGSCWAFASTSVIESHVAISSGLLFDLSVQQMAMCAPNPDSCGGTGGCYGSTSELAFDYVSGSSGLLQEYQYSYASYYGQDYECTMPASEAPVATIGGFVQLESNNYTALMNAVAQFGPVAISVDASNWHAYTGGVYSGCNQKNPDIDHAVVLVGYGVDEETKEKYWLVRNSWSPAWGEKGYIRLARSDREEEICGLDITPQDGTACAGDDTPVKVCGTCGVLFDSAFPTGAQAL